MSSEAAQKAYPVERQYALSGLIAREQQEAFDAGAVEALRQAAAELTAMGVGFGPVRHLMRMADEWEAGQ